MSDSCLKMADFSSQNDETLAEEEQQIISTTGIVNKGNLAKNSQQQNKKLHPNNSNSKLL